MAEQSRFKTRRLLESQLTKVAELEDRITQLEQLLTLEKKKLVALRESMTASLGSKRDDSDAGRFYRSFTAADFGAHEAPP